MGTLVRNEERLYAALPHFPQPVGRCDGYEALGLTASESGWWDSCQQTLDSKVEHYRHRSEDMDYCLNYIKAALLTAIEQALLAAQEARAHWAWRAFIHAKQRLAFWQHTLLLLEIQIGVHWSYQSIRVHHDGDQLVRLNPTMAVLYCAYKTS